MKPIKPVKTRDLVKKYRFKDGLKIREIAEKLGVSPQAVCLHIKRLRESGELERAVCPVCRQSIQ